MLRRRQQLYRGPDEHHVYTQTKCFAEEMAKSNDKTPSRKGGSDTPGRSGTGDRVKKNHNKRTPSKTTTRSDELSEQEIIEAQDYYDGYLRKRDATSASGHDGMVDNDDGLHTEVKYEASPTPTNSDEVIFMTDSASWSEANTPSRRSTAAPFTTPQSTDKRPVSTYRLPTSSSNARSEQGIMQNFVISPQGPRIAQHEHRTQPSPSTSRLPRSHYSAPGGMLKDMYNVTGTDDIELTRGEQRVVISALAREVVVLRGLITERAMVFVGSADNERYLYYLACARNRLRELADMLARGYDEYMAIKINIALDMVSNAKVRGRREGDNMYGTYKEWFLELRRMQPVVQIIKAWYNEPWEGCDKTEAADVTRRWKRLEEDLEDKHGRKKGQGGKGTPL